MKPTSKGAEDRRAADADVKRRGAPAERRTDGARAAVGDRRVVENRGIGEAMVDALEDILHWERASERAMKVAEKTSTPDLAH